MIKSLDWSICLLHRSSGCYNTFFSKGSVVPIEFIRLAAAHLGRIPRSGDGRLPTGDLYRGWSGGQMEYS